jgi:hypothetical protein
MAAGIHSQCTLLAVQNPTLKIPFRIYISAHHVSKHRETKRHQQISQHEFINNNIPMGKNSIFPIFSLRSLFFRKGKYI